MANTLMKNVLHINSGPYLTSVTEIHAGWPAFEEQPFLLA